MKIYMYDRNTKEFICEENAFLDPLESKIQNREIFLIPADAVTVPPPEGREGFARVWNGVDAWLYVEDHRKTVIWRSHSEKKVMTELGAIPEGWSKVRPEKPVSVSDYDKAMEDHITKTRLERGYTLREPSEYKDSSVPRWAQDAIDFIRFRDACMLYGLQIQNDFIAGKEVPALEEFKKDLPLCQWTYKGESI